MASKDSSGKKDLEVATVKDNFIPIFDGTPGAYREWRKRIQIYSRKMQLQKRESEAVLHLLGSLQGSAWRILEDYDLSKAEAGAMDEILATLDKSFKYDSKVELPADFAAYFEHLSRRGGQTLLQFITEHDECLRRIQNHGVDLRSAVQGWHLLSKANLTREQRQLIMTQTNSLDRIKVQEALFTILGQDYRAACASRWAGKASSKGRAYVVDEEELAENWEQSDYGYFLDDEYPDEFLEEHAWDDSEAGYFQQTADDPQDEADEEPYFDIQEFDEAYATYVDARRRFQDLKMSRGFLPVVALQDASTGSQAQPDQRPHSIPKGAAKKGSKGKGKSKGKTTVHYGKGPPKGADPRGRAKAVFASACLRCGSTSHKTAQCTQSAGQKPSQGTKRPAVESVANVETGLVIFEDRDGHERLDCAMLDPGASLFLMGFGPFLRYVEHLRGLDYPVDDIVLKKADRTFFFGGDHQAKSNWTVHLPVFIKGTAGLIQPFLLKGETPMLLGRPVASELGLDLKEHTMRYHPDESWRSCLLGRHGEYLIPLTEDFEPGLLEVPSPLTS